MIQFQLKPLEMSGNKNEIHISGRSLPPTHPRRRFIYKNSYINCIISFASLLRLLIDSHIQFTCFVLRFRAKTHRIHSDSHSDEVVYYEIHQFCCFEFFLSSFTTTSHPITQHTIWYQCHWDSSLANPHNVSVSCERKVRSVIKQTRFTLNIIKKKIVWAALAQTLKHFQNNHFILLISSSLWLASAHPSAPSETSKMASEIIETEILLKKKENQRSEVAVVGTLENHSD